MDAKVFKLTISDGGFEQHIEWPILRATDKALQVRTPGGDLWIPVWRFAVRQWSVGRIPELVKLIQSVSETSSESRARVWKAGPGPTSKSHKFQVAVRRCRNIDYGEVVHEIRRRTFTLPLSQIRGQRGSWSAPVWLLRKKLSAGETLARADWPGLDLVRRQLEGAATYVTQERRSREARDRAAREDERRRAVELRDGQEAEQNRLLHLLEDDGQLALEYCRRNFTLAQMAAGGVKLACWPTWPPRIEIKNFTKDSASGLVLNHELRKDSEILRRNLFELREAEKVLLFARSQPKFEAWKARNSGKSFEPRERKARVRTPDSVLENVRVEWVDWEGSSSCQIRRNRFAEGCTVKVFGKKHEIATPTGDIVVKMAGPNLKIHVM
jgi:hypothetical protein